MSIPTGKTTDFIAAREIEGNTLCLQAGKKDERDYRAVIETTPVNFSLMSESEQETVLESFRVLLARLSFPLMIHVRVEPYDLETYLKQIALAKERDDASAVIKEVADDHIDFVHSLAASRALLRRRFYLVVPADRLRAKGKSRAELADLAKSQLETRCQGLLEDLERMGLSGQRLGQLELARYYQSCVHATAAHTFPLTSAQIEAADRPVRSAKGRLSGGKLALPARETQEEAAFAEETDPIPQAKASEGKEPLGIVKLPELLAPSAVDVQWKQVRVHHYDLDEYLRGYAIIGYPAQVTAGWLDRLIQVEEPHIEIVMHIQPLASPPYIARQTRQLTGYRATQLLEERHGRDRNPYIKKALQEVEELREKLVAQEEQVFGVSLYLLVRAASRRELNERSNRLLSLLKSLELSAVSLALEHQRAWLSTLPDGRDILKRRKTLDTSSLVTAFPFASSSLAMDQGILTGIMPNGSLVVMNPSSDQLENGHEIKFSRSGAGKSYDEKMRIMRSLILGYHVIVIDPEDEYKRVCHKFHGADIRLSDGALKLNPLDLPASADSQDRNVLEEKFQSLLALCDLLLADRGGSLSQREKGYLSRCFAYTYGEKSITLNPITHGNPPPSMHDLYRVIRSGACGPDVYDLADRLERYLPAFPVRTEVRLDNPLVVFNIRDLNADLRPVGLFLITDFVWTQIRQHRHPRPRLLCIDEAWALLQFAEGGRFLASIARRGRKYNLCLRVTTQDVEDFLASEWGRTILVNSSMKFLMKQDSTTIDAVAQAFKLSDGERKFLTSCAKGEGLFFVRGSHVPMKVVASPLEHQLATTNPQELREEALAAMAKEEKQAGMALALPTNEEHQDDVILPEFLYQAREQDGVV
ncbi:MAG TPA: ATP-binding protein [Ktedonobacteraceae bacterium]|nr:ATP-binding protein [Ktedonobacteraceae bacterium]